MRVPESVLIHINKWGRRGSISYSRMPDKVYRRNGGIRKVITDVKIVGKSLIRNNIFT